MISIMLDDERGLEFIGCSGKANWIVCRTVEEVKFWLRAEEVKHLSLDHDLGQDENKNNLPTGYDLVCWMERTGIWPSGDIFVHSMNPVGAKKMIDALQHNGK